MTPRLFPLSVAFYIRTLAVLILTSAIAGQTDSTNEVFKRVDAYIISETAQHSFRGTVLVGKDGKIFLEKAYGMADEEWQGKRQRREKSGCGSLESVQSFWAASFRVAPAVTVDWLMHLYSVRISFGSDL
jgi:hypothetical protein